MVPKPSPAAAGEGRSTRAARSRAGSRPSSTSALTRSGACGRQWRRGRGGGDPSSPSRACPCPWGGGPLVTAGPRRTDTCGPNGGPRAVPSWRKRFVPPSCFCFCCCCLGPAISGERVIDPGTCVLQCAATCRRSVPIGPEGSRLDEGRPHRESPCPWRLRSVNDFRLLQTLSRCPCRWLGWRDSPSGSS